MTPQPQNTAPAMIKKIDDLVKALAAETDAARVSETLAAWAQTCAKFYQYSPSNQMLIMLQKPDASLVAGYSTWVAKWHRYVKKGEHGIAILAPCPYTRTNKQGQEENKVFFKITYVFDASQTEGEPLPEPPAWKSPEKNAELTARLLDFAHANQIKVIFSPLGQIQGTSAGGTITLDPSAGTKTLVHEIAHELLHHGEGRPSREQCELEAESIAYVVSSALGIKELHSPNYLALWEATGKKIMDSLTVIRKTAALILAAVQPNEPEPAPDAHLEAAYEERMEEPVFD